MGSYLPFFSISVEHLFFTKGMGPKLDFVPTHKTAMVLKNTVLLIRKTINGIYVFYDLKRAETLQLYADGPDHSLNFIFKAFSRDPRFQNYTAPPSYKEGAILYLDNRDVKADKTGRLRLHDEKHVTGKDFKKLDSPLVEEILDKKDMLARPAFIVDIGITKKQSSLLDKPLKTKCRNYYLSFGARQTFWKYYLLGSLERKRANIVDPEDRIVFESAGRESLSDNRSALTFRSKTPIPLQDSYDWRFQLREKCPEGEKVLIKRLPVASADQVSREIIGKKEAVVSEIYINT